MDAVSELSTSAATPASPEKQNLAVVPVLDSVLPPLPAAWVSQFELVPEMPILGSGAFGTIFQVRDRQSHCPFACKVMKRSYFEVRGIGAQLTFEVQAMQRVASVTNDPGWSKVVRLYGATEEAGCVFLLLELCIDGTLAHKLAAHPGGLPEALAARGCRHLFQGLREIHSVGIIHRDIKLENLLMTTNGVLKITDFGWAADSANTPQDLAGTFETMAPEVLREAAQTQAADMWSAGAVLFHAVVGRPPFQADIGAGATQLSHSDPHAAVRIRKNRLLERIEACCPPSSEARPSHVSEMCWDLLRRLLEPDVEQRISLEEALQHEWLNTSVPTQPRTETPQQVDRAAECTCDTVAVASAIQSAVVPPASAEQSTQQLEETADKDEFVECSNGKVAEFAVDDYGDGPSLAAKPEDSGILQSADKEALDTPETDSPMPSAASSSRESQCSSPRLAEEVLTTMDFWSLEGRGLSPSTIEQLPSGARLGLGFVGHFTRCAMLAVVRAQRDRE